MGWRSALLTSGLAPLVLFAAMHVNAASSSDKGAYRVLRQWPSGIHESMVRMVPDQRPLCEALAIAATQTYQSKAFTLCPVKMPASNEIVEAHWTRLSLPDAYAIAAGILKKSWQANYPTELPWQKAELLELKAAMSEGAVWLESANVSHFREGEETTRLVRIAKNGCDDDRHRQLFVGGEMAIAVGDGFDHLLLITGGLNSAETVLAYRDRSYLLGRSQRDGDNSFKRLARPQPELVVFDSVADGKIIRTTPICKVVFSPASHG